MNLGLIGADAIAKRCTNAKAVAHHAEAERCERFGIAAELQFFLIAPEFERAPDETDAAAKPFGGEMADLCGAMAFGETETRQASRAFNTVLMHNTRAALLQTDAFAGRNDMSFRFSAIPRDYPYNGSLAFDQASMSALFDYGHRCASSAHIWLNVQTAMARAELAERTAGATDTPACPVAGP